MDDIMNMPINGFEQDPDVPDFGAITGIPLSAYWKCKNPTCKSHHYCYDLNLTTPTAQTKYGEALKKAGFIGNDKGDMYTKGSRLVSIHTDTDHMEYHIQISKQ